MVVRWLLAGAGDIAGKRVGPALATAGSGALVAVCDIRPAAASGLAKELSVDVVYESYEKALADPNIDAVYVATPVFLHKEMAIQGLRAGKHVLVEKPMALNASDADEMNRTAQTAGKMLGVSYFRRYFDKYRYLKNALRDGRLGEVVLVRMAYYSWYNPQPSDPKYWRVIPEKSGGGPLSDMGTHMFDVLIGLFGIPTLVWAQTDTLVHSYEVEDTASVFMKLSGGAHATATFQWCSKTWSHEFEVIGTEGRIRWHPFDGPSFEETIGREIKTVNMPPADNVHFPLIEHFNQVVAGRSNEVFPCYGEDAAKCNALLDAVHGSSARMKAITL